ncbi:hypothetical protein [Aggregatibacter actinomycetemcomitans]|uniref:hypothetical protein n=1 Tax=Aggregatibacter actinomycetemcomitans TaxID=714 RepID=UPI0021CC7B14|nr:hypothetical protein [Aggregatibacter actinomycetemcomitans]
MQTENQIYAVNAELFYDNQPENVVILVYTANVDIAENHIRVYRQKHQICLHYSPSPPFLLKPTSNAMATKPLSNR